ncbi:MAG: SDR family oxidoreductase [Sideroxyarcus sp.]
MNLLVTGANGFVGSALVAALHRREFFVRCVLRTNTKLGDCTEIAVVGDMGGQADWREALSNMNVVIHLAARVHVMRESATDPLEAFREVNVAGTENLARQAAAAGVKRLVFVSSIKVNGENTLSPNPPDGTIGRTSNPLTKAASCQDIGYSHSAKPTKVADQAATCPASGGGGQNVFTETDIPRPQDPYGISKWEAEQVLHRVASETGLEIVIVRPPLVYGPGVKGNFVQMLKVLARGAPLPLASAHNLRSLVYVENLVDALLVCATHPAAAGQTYIVSDGEDVSTPELLCQLGTAMGRPARLFRCPPALLKLAGRLTGKADQVERLLGSLQVDSGRIRRELDWAPPYTLQQGLQATAEWYRNDHL